MPQVLKWTVARADEEYDPAVVEAARISSGSTRVMAESFPFAVAPEEVERRCRRALAEARIVVETWRRQFNAVRPHSSLSYKPPAPKVLIRPTTPPTAAPAVSTKPTMH